MRFFLIKIYFIDSMSNINNNNILGNKVVVKASDILKKLRTPQDRRNFAMENSKINFKR